LSPYPFEMVFSFTIKFSWVVTGDDKQDKMKAYINEFDWREEDIIHAGTCLLCGDELPCEYENYCGFTIYNRDNHKPLPKPVRSSESHMIWCNCNKHGRFVIDPFSKPDVQFLPTHTIATFKLATVVKTLPTQIVFLSQRFTCTRNLSDSELIELYNMCETKKPSAASVAKFGMVKNSISNTRTGEDVNTDDSSCDYVCDDDDDFYQTQQLGWPVNSPSCFEYMKLGNNKCPFEIIHDGCSNPMICFSPGLNGFFGFEINGD
jgi:hypothetical protein